MDSTCLPSVSPLESVISDSFSPSRIDSADDNNVLLDTEETTTHDFSTYQLYLLRKGMDEFVASASMYCDVDDRDGTNLNSRIINCRRKAWFVVHHQTGQVRVSSESCRLRWCPLCARSKAYHVSTSVKDWLIKVVIPKFLTLTLKHSHTPLNEQITRLYKCFREFRRRVFVKGKVDGGIWFTQITFSKSTGCWHPHLHIALDSDYLFQGTLSEIWQRCTGDSKIVDIKSIKDPEEVAKYVSRYVSRPTTVKNLPSNRRIELYDSLKSRRLCGTFGSAKGVNLTGISDIERKDWLTVNSFSDTCERRGFNSFCKVVFACWRSNSPLPIDILNDIRAHNQTVFPDSEFFKLSFEIFKESNYG